MKDLKFFKRKAKNWLIRNDVINGYNGLCGSEKEKQLIDSLSKIMYKLYTDRLPMK